MNDENKRKHLEFIQQVITRMNANSFLIKGWAVTLGSGAICTISQGYQWWFCLDHFFACTSFLVFGWLLFDA